jgi:hypothetical protein
MRRELEPPYLIARPPPAPGERVAVTADVTAGVIEVAMQGRWTPSLRIAAWVAVTKCFVEHPLAVVVDLHGLDDPLAASAPAWWTMGMTGARMAPPVAVVVCRPRATPLAARLNRLGAKRHLPVFATLDEARRAVSTRLPMTDRVQLRLAPRPDAVCRARELTVDACTAWDQPRVRRPAGLVVSELVDNAVRHAGTDIVVTVSRRGAGLHLAVNDDDPELPVLPGPASQRPGEPRDDSHGLRAVHAAAAAWGAIPTDTGKVVWALVRPDRS